MLPKVAPADGVGKSASHRHLPWSGAEVRYSASDYDMRELIQANDASHEASIRLALDAAGIEAVVQGPNPFGIDGASLARVFVVHDRDYERAAELVARLQYTPVGPIPREWRMRLVRLLALVAIVVIVAEALRGCGP
jgi:hypothetical protein